MAEGGGGAEAAGLGWGGPAGGAEAPGPGAERPGRAVAGLLAEARALDAAARQLLADHTRAQEAVRAALAPVLDELIAAELDQIAVARLREVTGGRLRLGALEDAGYTTVGAVHAASRHALRQIPGVGQQTADQALAAAKQLAQAVSETVSVRIDADAPDARAIALLQALHRLVEAGPELRRATESATRAARGLGALLPLAAPAAGRLRMLFARRRTREAALGAAARLRALTGELHRAGTPGLLAQSSVDLLREDAEPLAALVDFELRSAEYYSLLAEYTGGGTDVAAAEGFLPDEVAGRVREQRLDEGLLRVSLRGYQSFGARFALAQRRVVLGDEMGLGKTVQALAVLAHLAARGERHFLVVCPASVLINWTREIRSRSALRPVPVHGPARAEAFAEWQTGGGVALTTFDVLHALTDAAPGNSPSRSAASGSGSAGTGTGLAGTGTGLAGTLDTGFADPGVRPALLVVDEAHYVKNPAARRSRAVARWAERSERVLFLTGTPMENRVEEFRNLVRHLQPALVDRIEQGAGAAGSQAFRRAVAPAYLRRNQQDVLTELPALLKVDEWEEFSAADKEEYAEAVAAGNFMAMRRAAYAAPADSAKLERLRELLAEAADNGLKAVVFSYFREVLATVHAALGEDVFGPLTGELAAERRQQLVDDFAAAPGHAVLLSQIQAGGVGLNMQAASVVILCEPQVKPTMEHQAIARAHRMGQVRPVQVHRLLATDSVDERLLDILRNKDRLFDAYARRSDTAESDPEAVDVSDRSLARHIVEDEQRRLAGELGRREASAPEGSSEAAAASTESAPVESALPGEPEDERPATT
ncbi:DEAD/DEAH box helicase [Streptomyces physcomitrii]|uniref:DEAD/DEAH box helicase n=1 Tax=Streptomyces physcomitrii TaxID=2724184 RepID=A0ABX1GV36_9ACTN|nr:DEAD/DEAH box helicase [Streptomyces physcomitrii]NKI39939.1 DEAD/DEAH box helicase [Streptomyces physcomitrii]